MTDAQVHGNMDAVMGYMHEFYFESAAMILTLITVGKMLEARSKGKTTDALKEPDEARPEDRRTSSATGGKSPCRLSRCRRATCSSCVRVKAFPVDGVCWKA